ncbi:MAG: hypothetical protein Q9162_001914 [Coniocarpon cinnabarinum]
MSTNIYFWELIKNFLGRQLQTPPDTFYDPASASLEGQTVIMTGANTGLGLDACHKLVRLHVRRLVLGVRNLSKGERAKEALLKTAQREGVVVDIRVWQVDMKSFDSMKRFAQRAYNELDRLDVMFCNAGIENAQFATIDDVEETYSVNVIGTMYLGILMLPQLRRESDSACRNTKLLFTGSMVHMLADGTVLRDAPDGQILQTMTNKSRNNFGPTYLNSKFMMTLATRELAKREPLPQQLTRSGVVIAHVNPGWCATELFRSTGQSLGQKAAFKIFGRTSEVGSRTLAHAIVSADPNCHGKYLSECEVKAGGRWVENIDESDVVQERLFDELVAYYAKRDPSIQDIVRCRTEQVKNGDFSQMFKT